MIEKEITAIKVQKNNPQRVNIYLDGAFAFGLSRMTAAWLQTGKKLTADEIDTLQDEETHEKALQKTLHYLSFRSRSEHEIRHYLEEKGFSEPVILITIERLKEEKFVDDTDFALQWIENRNTFRPRSKRLLSLELRNKGIPETTIQNALDKVEISEEELAYKSAKRIAEKNCKLDWIPFKKKVGGYLGRRGFSYAVINPVLSQLWNEVCADPEGKNENG